MTHAQENLKLLVVGTMLDKQVDRQVSYEEAMSFASSIGASFIEVSARTGQNVHEAFSQLAHATSSALLGQ